MTKGTLKSPRKSSGSLGPARTVNWHPSSGTEVQQTSEQPRHTPSVQGPWLRVPKWGHRSVLPQDTAHFWEAHNCYSWDKYERIQNSRSRPHSLNIQYRYFFFLVCRNNNYSLEQSRTVLEDDTKISPFGKASMNFATNTNITLTKISDMYH